MYFLALYAAIDGIDLANDKSITLCKKDKSK